MFEMSVGKIGTPKIIATENRPINFEEFADLALEKIISISDSTPDPLKQQAKMFQENLKRILVYYFSEVSKVEKRRLAETLKNHGQVELANYILN
jgi:hypothetical protein